MPAPITRALISVSDKTGLDVLGRFLAGRGVEVFSTGGTARALVEAGVAAREVSELTGVPEMLDGRVKTLHPKVHGGILAVRGNAGHERDVAAHGIAAIDLVVVNLYPFERTAAAGADFDECIEQIDIGGPALIRSAAKNHGGVAVVVDPGDYAALMTDISDNAGGASPGMRRRLAAKAFARTAAYDTAIAAWFARAEGADLPEQFVLAGRRALALRYGENPHQNAALYLTGEDRPGVATARQVQGKELSYNNLGDADAALELVAEFAEPAVAIVKHANPSGVAVAGALAEAYARALACDPLSAFGGVVAANSTLDRAAAEAITAVFTEVVIAPDADAGALEVFAAKKRLRVLLTGALPDPAQPGLTARTVAGGLLVQSRDTGRADPASFRAVTRRPPTDAEQRDLVFAMTVCKHVKSNAVVFAKNGATAAIGAGQMSRVDAVRLAALKAADVAEAAGLAEPATRGAVLASDAFFPFADGLVAAVEAGAVAVIQPGGAQRDNEVIAAADDAGIAMVFTGQRHFRH